MRAMSVPVWFRPFLSGSERPGEADGAFLHVVIVERDVRLSDGETAGDGGGGSLHRPAVIERPRREGGYVVVSWKRDAGEVAPVGPPFVGEPEAQLQAAFEHADPAARRISTPLYWKRSASVSPSL